ncbi:MAG: hypothetical protein ACO3JL_05150 [Myxococcota bacterium]
MYLPLFSRALLLGLLLGSSVAHAIDPLELLGQQPKPFVEPSGYYQVLLPTGFDCAHNPASREVSCRGTRGPSAKLVIQVLEVPPSATSDIVALNEMERLKKKPHFRHVDSRREVIFGSPARLESFAYDYLGNVERSIGVQALYLVKQRRCFVLYFEAKLDQFALYAADLAALYGSFQPANLDDGGNPIIPPPEPKRSSRKPRTDEEFMEQQLERARSGAGLEGDSF